MEEIDKIKDVYFQFRKAQANFNNRGYRMPKDFEAHLKKMKPVNQKSIIKITKWFSTKWNNIDPYEYFSCGFSLYNKRFSYVKFFEDKILLLYIQKDKNTKRQIRVKKKALIDSAKFLKKYMRDNEILSLNEYIDTNDGSIKLATTHYMKNNIDSGFFVWLIKKGMKLSDEDRGLIPYISQHYRTINVMLNDIKPFLSKMEEGLKMKEEVCQQNTKEI
jgi:hypothetical protein